MGAICRAQRKEGRYAPVRSIGAVERFAEVFWLYRGHGRCGSACGDHRQVSCTDLQRIGSTTVSARRSSNDYGGHDAANRSFRDLESDQESPERIVELRAVDVAGLHPARSVHHWQAEEID